MRRQTPIAHLLYTHLYPHPTPTDPPTFSAHLARNLVPEVRIEVATFYGDLNSTEARYPGLNYCHGPHRMRLGRFKHHRRLFEAFDKLGLTYNEIQEFCCWEGTKWARERFEKDEGIVVKDTTGDEIGPFVDRRELRNQVGLIVDARRRNIERKTDIEVVVEPMRPQQLQLQQQAFREEDEVMSDAHSEEGEDEADEEGEETPTEAAAREEHISAVSRRRDHSVYQRVLSAYNSGSTLPPELEQLLKEESERGDFPMAPEIMNLLARRTDTTYHPLARGSSSTAPAAVSTPRPVA